MVRSNVLYTQGSVKCFYSIQLQPWFVDAVCVASSAGQGRLPVQGLLTTAMMLLIALACVVLVAVPFHSLGQDNRQQWSSAAQISRPMTVNVNMHGRALLSKPVENDERPASALATLSDARDMPYTPSWNTGHEGDRGAWMAASDEAEQILESAAFVCNHTACVAIPVEGAWADVVPMQPLEVRPEQSVEQDRLDEAVFSTLSDVTPSSDKVLGVPMQYMPTASLRGGGFVGGAVDGDEEEDECSGVSCFSFQHIAGKAMNMAGLMAPEMCELVHRTAFHPGLIGGSAVIPQQPDNLSGSNATVLAQQGYGTASIVSHRMTPSGRPSESHGSMPDSSQHIENSTEQSEPGDATGDQMLSVLFPVWAHDALDETALTPMRHMYVFVLDQQDLLTYQCSMSRPLYM